MAREIEMEAGLWWSKTYTTEVLVFATELTSQIGALGSFCVIYTYGRSRQRSSADWLESPGPVFAERLLGLCSVVRHSQGKLRVR